MAESAFSVISLLIALIIFCVPVILIINGVQMIRKEDKRLQNLLSLFLGIVVGVGEIAAVLSILLPYTGAFQSMTERGALKLSVFTLVLVLIAVSVVYGSLVFVSFMFYTLLLQIVPHKRDFDYVIIHGCGLLGGRRVSKLLADRLDKAIALYKKDPTPPIMIPSGGQGSDEDISEAECMYRYMTAHGIAPERIIREDRSGSTRENISFSLQKLQEAGLLPASGSMEGAQIAVVTNEFHTCRALCIAKNLGVQAGSVPAPSPWWLFPTFYVRELYGLLYQIFL